MTKPSELTEPPKKNTRSQIVATLLGLALFALSWFAIAGRVTWWQGWAFLLTFVTFSSILVWRTSRLNPELVRERTRPAEEAEGWDRGVMRIYTVVLGVLLIVCALDGGRYTWSTVPLGVQLIGWIFLSFAGTTVWHVMMTNAYLSSWARLQEDRGQVVIQEGMYRRVRHPMYLGIMVGFLGVPLVLRSWWAMIASAVIVGLFVYRTQREDQMLIDGLAGYAEYTKKVRYRLLPGIW